jgi:hypothetical protein
MLREKIEQLKRLLSEMGNPNPLEYQRIMEMFNAYKGAYNPNTEPIRCTKEELMFFLADKFRNWEFMRQLRDKSKNANIKTATGSFLAGMFYEMVSTIKKYDDEGWAAAGFDITPEEMNVLKEHRNTTFHVPDDTAKFMERHQGLMLLEGRLFEITYKNSGALLEYMGIQRGRYPAIEEMLEMAFLPSREKNFLWDNYKPDGD